MTIKELLNQIKTGKDLGVIDDKDKVIVTVDGQVCDIKSTGMPHVSFKDTARPLPVRIIMFIKHK